MKFPTWVTGPLNKGMRISKLDEYLEEIPSKYRVDKWPYDKAARIEEIEQARDQFMRATPIIDGDTISAEECNKFLADLPEVIGEPWK